MERCVGSYHLRKHLSPLQRRLSWLPVCTGLSHSVCACVTSLETCSGDTSVSTPHADGSDAYWGFVAVAASYYVNDFSLMGRRQRSHDVFCSRLCKIGFLLYLANILALPFFPISLRVNRNRGPVCLEHFHTVAFKIGLNSTQSSL